LKAAALLDKVRSRIPAAVNPTRIYCHRDGHRNEKLFLKIKNLGVAALTVRPQLTVGPGPGFDTISRSWQAEVTGEHLNTSGAVLRRTRCQHQPQSPTITTQRSLLLLLPDGRYDVQHLPVAGNNLFKFKLRLSY
jgi:hypothetical protein